MSIYYVYSYIRSDGSPYYIGKGKDRRAYQPHIRKNGVDLLPKDKSRITILHQSLTESQAFEIEKSLIEKFGKKTEGGILVNLTDGGEGSSGHSWGNWSEEDKARMSRQRKGKKLGPNSVPSPFKGVPRSEETKKKISEAHKGKVIGCNKKKSIAAKNRKTHPWTGKKRPTKTCPHCKKVGADYLMTRWHFDNCKSVKG